MARDRQRGREQDASSQSDREAQYGGVNESQGPIGQQRYAGGGYGQGRGQQRSGSEGRGQDNWQDQQYGGSGARGQGFGTGGAQQQGSEDEWGTGGHGSGSFGQSASDQSRKFGQGGYDQGQDYGEGFGRSGRPAQGGPYGQEYQGGSAGQQGYPRGSAGREGYQGRSANQHEFQGSEYGQQGYGSGFGSESTGGYESGRQMGYVGRGPKGYRRSDDRIREDVSEELTRHPGIDASDIEVRVENGEVTLTGAVDGRRAKRMAEDCVEQCSGVKEVHNQLRVNRQGNTQGKGEEMQPYSSQTRGRQ